ncbi:hypothetical protein [Legionella genomosp. 1]|uniref:hypothetical protein n=1 Tax=Legionella genomosp. 1 TaxID=1093625 RepID=UPI0010558229|nr:hypothetical protein [Legionella genomosp. 1]
MESLSVVKIVKDAFLKLHAYVLRKLGKKIVNLHEYNNEEVKVDINYPTISIKCIEAKNNGAAFRWSKKMNPGYEKYFEIEDNTRRYFTWGGQYLWIKREK